MYINNPKSLTHKCTVRMASYKYHVRGRITPFGFILAYWLTCLPWSTC